MNYYYTALVLVQYYFFTKGGRSGAYPVMKISEFEFIIETARC
jgi:hypothetical protein